MMRKQSRAVQVLGIFLSAILAGVSVWAWNRAVPGKPAPLPRGDYTYTLVYAEHRIRQLMKQRHLPSLAAALIDDQEVIWKEAFGLAQVEEKTPATVDTVYKLWSVSKIFTAIEMMRLVEEGRVNLDAPITDYLPSFSVPSRFPDSEPITVRSILAHHSGLPRNGCHRVEYRPGTHGVPAELVESLRNCQLAFPAGRRYKYSNIGPDLLGLVIQELRGESFASYMRENLLAPMGMEDSAFVSADISTQRESALGYEYYQGEYYPIEQGDVAGLASGNLYSTLEDMSDFARFIFRAGEADGGRIISPKTLGLMSEEQFSNESDSQSMGLGWKTASVLGSEAMVWHDGGAGEGIGSLVALLPERKLGVVLFANGTSFEGAVSVSLAVEILELMLETRFGVVPAEEGSPEPVHLDRSLLQEYVGRYIAFGQAMDVFLSGDRLRASIQGMTLDLIPVDQTRFRVGHWLVSLGLADLLQLPIDLRELEIEFLAGGRTEEAGLMIKFGDVSREICPRYPAVTDIPALWQGIAGEYTVVYRLASGLAGSQTAGRSEIKIEGGVLSMSGSVGPLIPISETEIVILSGPFVGETILYDPGTGHLYHQSVVFKPNRPASNADQE